MSLSIIKYDPNDYKLGEVLSLSDGDVISDNLRLTQFFSLYFQWAMQGNCWAYNSKNKTSRSVSHLSFDIEERVATQFFLETELEYVNTTHEWVFVRIEIFENCFEFESRVLDTFEENGKTFSIIEVPKSISIIKNRRHPRSKPHKETWIKWNDGASIQSFKISSISLSSIIIEGNLATGINGKIITESSEYSALTTRGFDGLTSIALKNENNLEIGRWFDYYRTHAYPQLERRASLPPKECVQLYADSGYFKKYNTCEIDDYIDTVIAAWKSFENLEHTASADYCVVNEGKPTGIGSSSYTYSDSQKEYWTFHSLCALKNENELDHTRALYSWRAEYNFSRLEDIDTLLFFSSQSRWIERVYVNFIMRKSESGVTPIRLYTITFKPKNHGVEVKRKRLSSTFERIMISKDGISGSALPDLLHVRQKLNCIIVSDETIPKEDIEIIGEQLAFVAGREITFRVSIPSNHLWTPDLPQDLPTDRLGILRKNDLIDFIASLTHSIEVTKRKKGLA